VSDDAANSERTAGIKPYSWKPGQSGNPSGRPKRQPIIDELRKVLDQGTDVPGETVADRLAALLVKHASKGNGQFMKLILEYVAGKPTEHIDVQGGGVTLVLREAKRPDDTCDDDNADGRPPAETT